MCGCVIVDGELCGCLIAEAEAEISAVSTSGAARFFPVRVVSLEMARQDWKCVRACVCVSAVSTPGAARFYPVSSITRDGAAVFEVCACMCVCVIFV